mgnify:CR=1 FL=1
MQIVIIDSPHANRDLLSFKISQATSKEVLCFDDLKSAWNMIEIIGDISLIICRDLDGKNLIADKLIPKLKTAKLNLSLVVVGTQVNEEFAGMVQLPLRSSVTHISAEVSKIINTKISTATNESEAQRLVAIKYKSIPIDLFKYFNIIPFDIYIRMKKGDTYQFIKRINCNEEFNRASILAYKEKKLTHLYIFRESYNDFSKFILTKFNELIDSKVVQNKSNEEIRKLVVYQLASTGFNEANLEIAKDSLAQIQTKILTSSSKLKLLQDAFQSQLGYRFQRSYMTCILASLINSRLSWGDPSYTEHLVMASYLHDRFLENEEEMQVSCEMELFNTIANIKDHPRVESHAKLSADEILKNDKIPESVEKIVRQHHGSATGVGFSTELTSRISKLSILFLVADECALSLLCVPSGKVIFESVAKEISSKYYNHETVSECLIALKKAISEKKGPQ